MNPIEALDQGYSYKQVIRGIEKEILIQLLDRFDGNVYKISVHCLMTSAGVRKKLRSLGLYDRIGPKNSEHPSSSFHSSKNQKAPA